MLKNIGVIYFISSILSKEKGRLKSVLFLVPLTGLEPVRSLNRGILNPLRLPIPPQRHL